MINVDIKLAEGAIAPTYATRGSAGCDIRANLKDEVIVIRPNKQAVIPTGVYMKIPDGYEMQVRPRSGLAAKNGITIVNSPGTIDSDYRGEIKVILRNEGSEPFRIIHGDRIAQLVLKEVEQAAFVVVDVFDETARGEGGFGHTGIR